MEKKAKSYAKILRLNHIGNASKTHQCFGPRDAKNDVITQDVLNSKTILFFNLLRYVIFIHYLCQKIKALI